MKKFLIVLTALFLIITIGIIYLNDVVLPVKTRAFIINTLEQNTGKKVTLGSVQFNIFKGLVLSNLTIYDNDKIILSFKECDLSFFIHSLSKRKIIIPSIKFVSPYLYLERRADDTFNIEYLFSPQDKLSVNLIVFKVAVVGGDVDFKDYTLEKPFSKSFCNLNATAHLSLPMSVKFNASFKNSLESPTLVSLSGKYSLMNRQLTAKIFINKFRPREFQPYFNRAKILFNDGEVDAQFNLHFMDELLKVDANIIHGSLTAAKDRVSAKLKFQVKFFIQYDFLMNKLNFSGLAKILQSNLKGIDYIDTVEDINGEFRFSNSVISADNLSLKIFGLPMRSNLLFRESENPYLRINILSFSDLKYAQKLAKEKFNLNFPVGVDGKGKVILNLELKDSKLNITGNVSTDSAKLSSKRIKFPVEDIKGSVDFSQNDLRWAGVNFKFMDKIYKTSGSLNNFKSPELKVNLASDNVLVDTAFAYRERQVSIAKLDGKYYNSKFFIKGNVDTQDSQNLNADLKGDLEFELADLNNILGKPKENLDKLKLKGLLFTKFDLIGNLRNLKFCTVNADVTCPALSVLGLKTEKLFFHYSQDGGIVDIPLLNLSLYDGKVAMSSKIDLNEEKLPFRLKAEINNLDIQKLKQDTAQKELDLAGFITAMVGLEGEFKDINKLSGDGRILISNGDLWHLNLFKGIGSFLLTKDFKDLLFYEGSCSFNIKNRMISTQDLLLKSKYADLIGYAKINFDSKIDAAINVHINEEAVPEGSGMKNATTEILGRSSKFGTIFISGNLKEPEFKFKAAVGDIFKSIRDAIFKK